MLHANYQSATINGWLIVA